MFTGTIAKPKPKIPPIRKANIRVYFVPIALASKADKKQALPSETDDRITF